MEENKKSNNNLIIISAVIILIVGAGSFYGGLKYAQSKAGIQPSAQGNGRLQGVRGNGFAGNQTGGNRAAGGGFVNGSIIKQDDKSITLKLPDSGSKIVYFTDTTNFSKTATGTKADLIIGENVVANGTANSDGSIIAQSVQIRPVGEFRPQQPPQN